MQSRIAPEDTFQKPILTSEREAPFSKQKHRETQRHKHPNTQQNTSWRLRFAPPYSAGPGDVVQSAPRTPARISEPSPARQAAKLRPTIVKTHTSTECTPGWPQMIPAAPISVHPGCHCNPGWSILAHPGLLCNPGWRHFAPHFGPSGIAL